MAVAAAGCGGWEVPHDQGSRRQESSGHSDEVQVQDQLTRVNVQVVARGHDQGGGASGDKDDTLTVGGRAAGKSRVVSWADALDEEQQAREMDDDDWQLR